MTPLFSPYSSQSQLEECIRSALETGFLPPGMAAYACHLLAEPTLSDRDRTLLQILHDAIEDGCVQPTAIEAIADDC